MDLEGEVWTGRLDFGALGPFQGQYTPPPVYSKGNRPGHEYPLPFPH
jgi:hypothetical protein